MTERPDLGVMWRTYFDEEQLRLRREFRRLVVEEHWCSGARHHLRAIVLRSPFGLWVAWRPAGFPRDVWMQDWVDASPVIDVTCNCRRTARVVLTQQDAVP